MARPCWVAAHMLSRVGAGQRLAQVPPVCWADDPVGAYQYCETRYRLTGGAAAVTRVVEGGVGAEGACAVFDKSGDLGSSRPSRVTTTALRVRADGGLRRYGAPPARV